MPNKSSRTVNDLHQKRSFSEFLGILSQGICVFAVSLGALVTGGIMSSAIGLVLLCPVLIIVCIGWSRARPAILATLVSLLAIGLMTIFGFVPPRIESATVYTPWLVLGGAGLVFCLMLARTGEAVRFTAPDMPVHQAQGVAPFLCVALSRYGRVRNISGDATLLPGLSAGKEFEPILHAASCDPVLKADTPDGDVYIFAPDNIAQRISPDTGFEDISGLSHDLKAPLTSILGFAQMMRDEELGPDPSAYKDYPALIHESGETLQARVETLLELMRARSGILDLERAPIDINAAISEVAGTFRPQARGAGVNLVIDVIAHTTALGDRTAYMRIVENLISNAIKYTPKGGRVAVTAETYEGQVITCVTDQGTGISGADLGRLAEPFAQGAHTRGREGIGLGLALVKRLVALQDGAFIIRTANNFGTQMTVKLPAYTGQGTGRAED